MIPTPGTFSKPNPNDNIPKINIDITTPKIEPVTKAIKLKTRPDGAKLFAMITKFLFLKIKMPKDRKAMNEKIPREIHAAGT